MTVLLEGLHAVKHALRFAPDLVDAVEVSDLDRARSLAQRLAPDVAALLLARATHADVDHPTGVRATARRPAYGDEVLRVRRAPLVLLDRPRAAGNAGAVVRSAAAAGASGVVMTGTLDPWHPAVLRGSAGLHYALPVLHLPDEAAVLDLVTGPLLVLDAGGARLGPVPDDAVLVVGSERAGVGAALRGQAAAVVSLPMREGVSSLNLATTATAVLYAWRLAAGR